MLTWRVDNLFSISGILKKYFLHLTKLSLALSRSKYIELKKRQETASLSRADCGLAMRTHRSSLPGNSKPQACVFSKTHKSPGSEMWKLLSLLDASDWRMRTTLENPPKGHVWVPSGCRLPPMCPFLLLAGDSGILSKTAWAHASGWDSFKSHIAGVFNFMV